MNQVKIVLWENKKPIGRYLKHSVLYSGQYLNEIIKKIRRNKPYSNPTEITIKIQMQWDTIPAMSIDGEMLLYCMKEQPLVKIIWIVGKCRKEKRAEIKSEWNLTGIFDSKDVSRRFYRNSDYEYHNKCFCYGKKHSAWCLYSKKYFNKDTSKQIENFLNPLVSKTKEIELLKKEHQGHIILENISIFPGVGKYEVVLNKEFWTSIELTKVDCIDFDIYVE